MGDETTDILSIPEAQHERLAHAVMQRQAALSIRVAAVFFVLLFGTPLVNHLAPKLANQTVFGFTATWLFLGVLFFPITWLLAAYFIRASDRIERECADWRKVLGAEADTVPGAEVTPAFTDSDKGGQP